MKNMKRVISTLLMLSMMAALLCVPAFAAEPLTVSELTIIPSSAVIPANAGASDPFSFTAQLGPVGATNINDPLQIQWSLNGKSYINTASGGSATVAYRADEFVYDENVITAAVVGYPNISDSITVTKETVPNLGANDTISLSPSNTELKVGQSAYIQATVNGVNDNSVVVFRSSDSSVVSVSEYGDITAVNLGTATITAYIKNNEAVHASCTVNAVSNGTEKTTVSINPVPTTLQKGQTIDIFASVTGDPKTAVFDHWHLDSADAAYVSLGYDKAQSTTLTARAATKSPVTLYAFAKDGTSTYVQFTIAANENLQLVASPENIYYDYAGKAKTSVVSVANGFVGEEFTWNIVPSAQYGVLAGSNSYGNSVEVTAGPLEGRINITATSKSDATRTATITVFVNTEAAYGGAKITPAVATWQKGQAALKFEVSPAYYKSYLDGKLLTPESRSYTYYNGVLTLSTGLLSTLSSGEHILKVHTSSGNGIDGLVYATIYVTGSASNVYGDNAHVRGSAYNLYFTSTDPIKEVYISNQWIDPANYVLTNNGTGLTLKSDFLNKLGYGSYSMRLVTQNGYNQNASFRIVTANYAPATGDDANLGAWMVLLTLSLAGAIALIPKRKQSTDIIG